MGAVDTQFRYVYFLQNPESVGDGERTGMSRREWLSDHMYPPSLLLDSPWTWSINNTYIPISNRYVS